jgi:hypothetical protein
MSNPKAQSGIVIGICVFAVPMLLYGFLSHGWLEGS